MQSWYNSLSIFTLHSCAGQINILLIKFCIQYNFVNQSVAKYYHVSWLSYWNNLLSYTWNIALKIHLDANSLGILL